MRFAERSEFGSNTSAFAQALEQARTRRDFIDLSLSNPTRCGFDYGSFELAALGTEASLCYAAEPMGARDARTAVAALYPRAERDRIVLTASTSEAYGYLFRLLCDPGDHVLVPSPSYPLFDLLARLHDVELVHYPLVYHDGWQVDPATLAKAVTSRTRAIVLIHPNNPTGHFCSSQDRDAIFAMATRHQLPVIVDEVFLEYPVEGKGVSFADAGCPVLTFVLGGVSKSLAMPQMKLAWTVVCGPDGIAAEAVERLEVIADTFLSVGTPIQAAVPVWLPRRENLQQQVLARVRENLSALDRLLHGTSLDRLKVEAGWSVVLRVPALEEDTALAVHLLQTRAVAVHPGSFYGFADRGWLVLSLLPEPQAFREAVSRVVAAFDSPLAASS